MTFALLGVLVGACCSGTAAILQAQAAQREPSREGLDATLLLRLVQRPRYLLALALIVAGFALSIVALRTLPLFVVQAGRASSLAVTAVLAVPLLRTRLSRLEVGAVVAVVGGLVLLAATSGSNPSSTTAGGTRVALLVGVLAIAAAAVAAARIRPVPRSGLALGALAGLCFAVLALGARIVRGYSPVVLLGDPAAWAMGGAGLLGLLLAATALQRTSVVAATAPMVAVETVVGAGLGWLLCGDRPAEGSAAIAALGFVLVLAGALSLTRFAAPATAGPMASGTSQGRTAS